MSGLEQRTKGRDEAPACPTAVIAFTGEAKPAPLLEWPSIDADLLDERRAPVPAFPLEVLPPPWRDWASEAALAADAPVDYVAQAVLAAVAGSCGRRVMVWATPDWPEPVRLWLAAVGAPSTGKSPALYTVGFLLDCISYESGRDGVDVILRDGRFEEMVQALDDAPNGRLLWRDGDTNCFSPVGGTRGLRHIDGPALSILGTIEPDAVARALPRGPYGEAMAARFLYAWPHPAPFRRPDRDRRLDSNAVQDELLRIQQGVNPRLARYDLIPEPSAAAAFDAFHERLHPQIRRAEGLEAAWLGKGRGAVAALAGVLALLAWSANKSDEPPRVVDAASMEHAIALWSNYYRPHALSFFQRAVPTDIESQAGRVVRWLRRQGAASVSRTDVRRSALSHTVDARGAERVVARLVEGGVLQPMTREPHLRRGRPALRWHVNPMLAGAQGVAA